MRVRDDKAMPVIDRVDVHKGERCVVAPNLFARARPRHDPAKDAIVGPRLGKDRVQQAAFG
jgi:hypothetical protein